MPIETPQTPAASPPPSPLHAFARKDVLSGLMFAGIAALGLWVSRHYPIGTAQRMSTGYVPRLLCWTLLALGVVVLVQGLRQKEAPAVLEAGGLARLWPLLVVTASLVAFGLAIEQLGLVLAVLLLIGIGSLAARGIKVWEALAAAVVLIVISWAIFILGLGLTIPVWPEW